MAANIMDAILKHFTKTKKAENTSKVTSKVSDDLEEAAKHYLYSNILYDDVYVGNPTDKDCIEMFKAGAKWQKEQMMAKAVDGTLSFGELADGTPIDSIFVLNKEARSKYKDSENVKLIVIKES